IRKHLRTPIYAFFRPEMAIEYRRNKTSGKNQKHHMFTCAARGCKHRVARNLETQDRTSTKNLKDHAIRCWGKDTVTAALEMQNLDKARGLVKKHGGKKNGLLTTAFTKLKKAGARIFSHVPLTKPEVRIVKDRAFEKLMKSGRPETYIPHPTTISRDTKVLFGKTRRRLATFFQNYPGRIALATDAWTSPNHRAFVAYSAHWEENGEPVSAMLDFRELAESHTGEALA
ncbi:hypothetical protein BDZ89DRAFT_902107, partial [Hymenopellis radicata]